MRVAPWSAKALTVIVLVLSCAAVLPAQTFTTLHNFSGADGDQPYGALLQASDGNFYGTTQFGGAYGPCTDFGPGCGTVFRITPEGMLTTLHSFDGTDGSSLLGGLIQATNGNLYGNAYCGPGGGCSGTVYSLTSGGAFTTLYNFNGTGNEWPQGNLIQAINGEFYGGTQIGGDQGGYGMVFSITASGVLSNVHSFDGTDGTFPNGLVQGANGTFYGTTAGGGLGTHCTNGPGCGTVFSLTADGSFASLYSFCVHPYCPDGNDPSAALVQGTDGKLYGTAQLGGIGHKIYHGCVEGCGTVFSITPGGKLKTLYVFCTQTSTRADCADGDGPSAALVQGTDGNFYGTTLMGGTRGYGTIFQITPTGTLRTLHNFDISDSYYPTGLIQGTDGNFYGTTQVGGAYYDGTVYKLSMGFGPFVESNPAAAKVGATIGILGTDLTSASSVTFNGISAAFMVKSATFIVATIPSGATTGKIQVVTPNATLSSNVPFIVLP